MSEVRDEISRSIKLKKDWLLGFLVGNIILYSCLLPLIGFSSINGPLFSVMIIIIYGAVETILFFGCKQYSWPVSVTFRVLIGIHDFILFLVYAVLAVQGPNKYERCVEYRYYSDSGYQESEEMKHFSIKDSLLFNFTKKMSRVKSYLSHWWPKKGRCTFLPTPRGYSDDCKDLTNFSACCCFLFTINFVVNVIIISIYAVQPESTCCASNPNSCCPCCRPTPVQAVVVNGSNIPMQFRDEIVIEFLDFFKNSELLVWLIWITFTTPRYRLQSKRKTVLFYNFI